MISSPSTQGTKETLLSSKGNVKPSSTATHAQKPPCTMTGTLTNVRCNQGPLEDSVTVQGTEGSFTYTTGKLERSASFQKKLGHSSYIVEYLYTLPCFQGTTDPLPPTGVMLTPKFENRKSEKFPSEKRSSSSTRT